MWTKVWLVLKVDDDNKNHFFFQFPFNPSDHDVHNAVSLKIPRDFCVDISFPNERRGVKYFSLPFSWLFIVQICFVLLGIFLGRGDLFPFSSVYLHIFFTYNCWLLTFSSRINLSFTLNNRFFIENKNKLQISCNKMNDDVDADQRAKL